VPGLGVKDDDAMSTMVDTDDQRVPCCCGCFRRLWVEPGELEVGPITCGLCGSDFELDQTVR
jgi:hypothetical protein